MSLTLPTSRQEHVDEWLRDYCMKLGMTKKQAKVAVEVVKGKSNKDIAAAADLGIGTVKFHMTSIFKLTGLKSRTQLALHLHEVMKHVEV